MPVIFRPAFKISMLSRFLKVAITMPNVVDQIYNGRFAPEFCVSMRKNEEKVHWRKTSYSNFTYIFPLVLLFIS